MNSGQTVFAQLLDFAPRYEFLLCVDRYRGDYKVQSFSCCPISNFLWLVLIPSFNFASVMLTSFHNRE
jgi:hypothetical protein